jgi:hypothetical protein
MALSPLGIALMMQQPTPAPRPGQVAPTDVEGAFNASTQEANTQYQAKLQQQNALWGGLAGLGAAGIIGGSKVPAIQDAVSNLLSPGTGATSYSGLASNASTLGDWMSDPALASIGTGAAPGGAPAVWNLGAGTGAAGAADAGATGAADVGSVAAADAAATGAADAGAAGAADAGGMGVADLISLLFA